MDVVPSRVRKNLCASNCLYKTDEVHLQKWLHMSPGETVFLFRLLCEEVSYRYLDEIEINLLFSVYYCFVLFLEKSITCGNQYYSPILKIIGNEFTSRVIFMLPNFTYILHIFSSD